MPEGPEFNLDSILAKEKQEGLSQLDPGFYDKVGGLLSELEAQKKIAEPDSVQDNYLRDRLVEAEGQILEIIHERMKKITDIAASHPAKRTKSDAPSLTPEESKLYNALLNLITGRRQELDKLFMRGKNTVVSPELKEPEKPMVMKPRDISGYIMVRLLRNIPSFVGFDNRNYTLAKEDVAMVPGVNARALIARKAAVQVGH